MQKISVTLEPIDQILNFAGPWVGDLTINGTKFQGSYLQDFLIDESNQRVFIARYFAKGYFRWQQYFRIQILSLRDNKILLSKLKFKAIYLENLTEDDIYFYECFSEGDKNTLRKMSVGDANFTVTRI